MTEDAPELDHHVTETSKMFRDAGYTINAVRYPLSDAAVDWVCKFNGAPDGWKPPMAWRYAPNPAMQAMIERKATERRVDDKRRVTGGESAAIEIV